MELAQEFLPESTYRLQFHAGFTFRDALEIVPYLADLGITHCYASPFLKARPGSTHGYDICDHGQLNPEIGTDEDLAAFSAALKEQGMGLILDVVPNHMGIIGNENVWWNDVLENGPASPYAGYFDIGWRASPRPELQDRVLLPILGEPYGKVLESGQIRLEREAGTFYLRYSQHRFPTAPESHALILDLGISEIERIGGKESPALVEYQSILTAVRHLPAHWETDSARIAEYRREKEVIKRRLAALLQESITVREVIDQAIGKMNGEPGNARSFDHLDQLLKQQAYRLAYWKVAADEINYRRFFDVNELAALSMEREDVFQAAHQLVFRLLSERKLDGLRIDHPDGLFNPRQYLERLQQHFLSARAPTLITKESENPEGIGKEPAFDNSKPPLYVVVEKILARNEALPPDWPVHGTSGYDFLSAINGLYVDGKNVEAFNRLYQNWSHQHWSFREIVYQKKLLILQAAMYGELHMLAQELDRLAQKNRWSRDFTLHSLHQVLREIIACFPVYRSYITAAGVTETDRKVVLSVVRQAMHRNPTISTSLFRFVQDILLLESSATAPGVSLDEQVHFAGKFQQITAPVMAKGVEDTAYYVFNRLLSVNEVGSDPSYFGISRASVHKYNQERQAKWPRALSPLSTHDSKRSEDVRARLNVLSEIPGEWEACLARWSRLNEPLKKEIDGSPVPDANEECYLYQTLTGAWPLGLPSDKEGCDFSCRIKQHMIKALREAKVHSSWMNPDSGYDDAVLGFVSDLLDAKKSQPFLDDFATFQKRISQLGQWNSLSQTLLRISAPGVPDTYQGTELWDLSLVDPDNRRPVDYGRRRQILEDLKLQIEAKGRLQLAQELVAGMEDGRIKLYLSWQALAFRRDHPGLLSAGEYIPLTVTGPKERHVFAFARRRGTDMAVVVVPRLLSSLCPNASGLPLAEVWSDTRLELPGDLGASFTNLLTGEAIDIKTTDGRSAIPLSDILKHFPVALLANPSPG